LRAASSSLCAAFRSAAAERKAAHKEEEAARKAAHEAEEAARKEAHEADKVEDRLERSTKHQEKHLLKGLHLTRDQKVQIRAIEKKYDDQLKALVKADEAADKAHTPTSDLAAVTALRDAERAELRAVLTPAQQTRFDQNVTKFDHKK
jgi:flagellar motility protein MotE (MotC chaperone)